MSSVWVNVPKTPRNPRSRLWRDLPPVPEWTKSRLSGVERHTRDVAGRPSRPRGRRVDTRGRSPDPSGGRRGVHTARQSLRRWRVEPGRGWNRPSNRLVARVRSARGCLAATRAAPNTPRVGLGRGRWRQTFRDGRGHTRGNALSQVPTVTEYDPRTDTWTPQPPLPEARMAHAAAGLGSVIYAIGGAADGAWIGDVVSYDTGLSPLPVGASGRALIGWAAVKRAVRNGTR